MIIYNPHNEQIIQQRLQKAKDILNNINAKHCFITGSFLFKKNYKDIDVFVISRTKKKLEPINKKIKITILDFNELHSLFYHSVSKSCIAKSILPTKSVKATISDYWQVINEAVPSLLNQKNKFHKTIRYLILYTEYFKTGEILDTFKLSKMIHSFKNYKEILSYVQNEIPGIIKNKIKQSYAKRFLYTQAGHYKELLQYRAQSFLYKLIHSITRGINHGQSC
ncbi:hypothetical protein KY314_03030 [Candidatus Woesearchaeota archaeon]|nr:hypothetical protein [Candidatus Woesearchaeota archaeon]